MGDGAQFHYGKQGSGSGLEFTGGKKKSLFAAYTAQFESATSKHNPAPPKASQSQPVSVPLTVQKVTYEDDLAARTRTAHTAHAPHQRTAHHAAPSATPAAVAPDPEAVNLENLFDDDDSDSILSDIPDSHINRPHIKQEKKRQKAKQLEADGIKPMSTLKKIFGGVAFVTGIAIMVVSVLFLLNTRPVVSAEIKKQAGFPVYEMVPNTMFTLDRTSVEINDNGSLVYIAYQKSNKEKFVISQQAVPEVIKADEQFQSFLTETDKFASADTKIGKAYFTRPANLGEDISVVVKTETTLLFIRGHGTTEEQTWLDLLSTINVVK